VTATANAAATPAGTRRQTLLGPDLILTTLVVSIISSLGAPLLINLAQHFHESISTAQWSLTVTLVAGAVASPVLGRLGTGGTAATRSSPAWPL
jgi:MFS family permease